MASKSPEKALGQRIRELRRRHFGARGKVRFAERLGIPVEELERYERGTLPPGGLMVRMCELTGEDLQWLLTGVSARTTVVISGTRGRHQELLGRLARLLDDHPELAAPVEAFVDLLGHGAGIRGNELPALAGTTREQLIPVLSSDELPTGWEGDGGGFDLAVYRRGEPVDERRDYRLSEPQMRYEPGSGHDARVVTLRDDAGDVRRFVHNAEVAACFAQAFGVEMSDDAMKPMFAGGDVLLATADAHAKIGRPAICRLREAPYCACRIWLGAEVDGRVFLGRLSDGGTEEISEDNLLWAREVLFRLGRAA